MTRSTLATAYVRKARICQWSGLRFKRWGDDRMALQCFNARNEFIALARTARALMA